MKYIFGNWKLNQDTNSTIKYAKLFNKQKMENDLEFGLAVPFPYISVLQKKLGKKCKIGAQNVAFAEKGAYTGEISASMLKDLGAEFCLVGHSERRQVFKETNFDVNKKIKQLVAVGILPMLCIGETLKEFKANKTEQVLQEQLMQCLTEVKPCELIVAYEPVWAIGTGKTATKADIDKNIKFIKNFLIELWGNIGKKIQVLYGGSVKPENANELLSGDIVNGALVGGASLMADKFVQIGQNIIRR